ncbi:MAG: hypothetical protein KF819_03260 [Labilithrix sp.]|nr:hypothetical protein [Labilithrix sp.]
MDGTHVYRGRLFIEARDCLGTTSSVDVIEGDEPANDCPAKCVAQRRAEGGRAIYVSTTCGAAPLDFDLSGSDPACPAALAAHTRNDTCSSDGGSSNPIVDASME